MWKGKEALEMIYKYQICDGVVTLSDCDQKYVCNFARNSKYILNPLTFSFESQCISAYEANTILWIGRISYEKRPLDPIRMMQYVVKEIPTAKLYIVGSGDENILNQMKALIHSLNLSENIIMTGFTEHVEEYYKKASVFVVTSEYEGFPLTMSEALEYGLPIVSYDMPWLTFMRDGRGIIPVQQRDYYAMAQQTIHLLKDPDLCKKTGHQGKEHIMEICQTDIGKEWRLFIEQVNQQTVMHDVRKNTAESILFEYLTIFQEKSKTGHPLQAKIDKLKKSKIYKVYKVGKIVVEKLRLLKRNLHNTLRLKGGE